jgi:hypothetical protein
MRNRGLSLIVVALVALASHVETQHMARGTGTDGSRAEVEASIEKTAATTTGGSVKHSQITEVCHVIEGKATLATGDHRKRLGVGRRHEGGQGAERPEHARGRGSEWYEPPGWIGGRGNYSAEYAALVERDRIARDCLLGGARRSAQSAAGGLRGEVNRSRAMEEENYEA